MHVKKKESSIESDTIVTFFPFFSSFLDLNQKFIFFIFALLSSDVACNPKESDSLEFSLPLQVPLMAYGDGYLFLIV